MSVDIELIKKLPMFANASEALLSDVSAQAIIKTIPEGLQIAYEGMTSEWFFIVLSAIFAFTK